jgi:KDO2-lipid IV(A) lauroyltransferase
LADIFAWFIKKIMKYRSGVIWTNVARSFPHLKYKALTDIVGDFYTHLGEIIAEAIWFSGSSYKRLYDSGIVTVMNPEEITRIYNESPSVTVLSTHCGNWEILGGIFAYLDDSGVEHPITQEHVRVVYKKLSSDVSDEVFKRNRISPLTGDKEQCVVESSSILRYAISHRNEKKLYIYPADQAPYRGTGRHPIGEFMCQQTFAMQGSVGVACKLSHSVMYLKMKRVKRGQYEFTFIPMALDASATTPELLLRKYYDLLEEEIRETPSNWLWSHKRWK